jgi:hypothetical protein
MIDAHLHGRLLAALLEQVEEYVCRFVSFPDPVHQPPTVALWVAHTHLIDAAEFTPYLIITAPEKRSGKTLLLETLSSLVFEPLSTHNLTPALLFRLIDSKPSTLLLDEYDTIFTKGSERADELRGLVNAGFSRGSRAYRLERKGNDYEPRSFDVFCAKALAGIGKVPDTIADRGIPIGLKRKRPGDTKERFRRDQKAQGVPIQEALSDLVPEILEPLISVHPRLPLELSDRAADAWEPLLAIADRAGGDWPIRARRAAIELSALTDAEDDTLGVRLLSDIHHTFVDTGLDRLFTTDLLSKLYDLDESPWGDLQGKSLTARRLANLLRPYGVRRGDIRINNHSEYVKGAPTTEFRDHGKGYQRQDFEDAWSRYLPSIGDSGDIGAATTAIDGASIGDMTSLSPIDDAQKSLPQPMLSPMSPLKGRDEASDVERKLRERHPEWSRFLDGEGPPPAIDELPDSCTKCGLSIEGHTPATDGGYDQTGRPLCHHHLSTRGTG